MKMGCWFRNEGVNSSRPHQGPCFQEPWLCNATDYGEAQASIPSGFSPPLCTLCLWNYLFFESHERLKNYPSIILASLVKFNGYFLLDLPYFYNLAICFDGLKLGPLPSVPVLPCWVTNHSMLGGINHRSVDQQSEPGTSKDALMLHDV